jgi:hypothetical protein
VKCPVKVARGAIGEPLPTGIELTITYDPALLTIDNFYSEWCFEGAGCFELPSVGPGSSTLQSGHSVSVAPLKLADWAGQGSVIIVNAGDPTTPLSEAYLDAQGEVVGDPAFVEVWFTLATDIDPQTPATIDITEPLASDALARSLITELINGLIVSWLEKP